LLVASKLADHKYFVDVSVDSNQEVFAQAKIVLLKLLKYILPGKCLWVPLVKLLDARFACINEANRERQSSNRFLVICVAPFVDKTTSAKWVSTLNSVSVKFIFISRITFHSIYFRF